MRDRDEIQTELYDIYKTIDEFKDRNIFQRRANPSLNIKDECLAADISIS